MEAVDPPTWVLGVTLMLLTTELLLQPYFCFIFVKIVLLYCGFRLPPFVVF